MSFRKKMYLSILTLMFLLLTVSTFFFYTYISRTLAKNSQDSLSSSTTLILNNIDNLLKRADNSLKELQTNETLFTIAKETSPISENYFSAYSSKRDSFRNAFQAIITTQGYDASLHFVSSNHDYVGTTDYSVTAAERANSVTKASLLENKELNAIMQNIKYEVYLPPHTSYFSENASVFSVARSMRNTYHSYGLLVMDFNVSVLTDFLTTFKNPGDYSISILDERQNLIYSSSPILDSKNFLNNYNAAKKSNKDTFSINDTSLFCYKTSDLTGWTFVLNSNLSDYLESLRQLLILCFIVFLLLFASIALFLHLVSKHLTKPLEQLSRQLQALKPGQNITVMPLKEDDEISNLANKIQTYLTEIYTKNEQLAESHQRTLKAHYDAMEAQLNPHFLYNTLSVIGMTGLSTGNVAVSDMCGELASLLRYSLSYARQSVLLEQEITNANHYLYIMKCRFESNLQYEWEWDETLNKVHVPKLILQPLIENCFQHGFKPVNDDIRPPWKLKIHSHKDDTSWYITVSNNGQSFSQENLIKLYQHFHQVPSYDSSIKNAEEIWEHHGFGLENTILRLNIYYHGEAIFHVSTTEMGWTAVTIGGPLYPQEGTYFSNK